MSTNKRGPKNIIMYKFGHDFVDGFIQHNSPLLLLPLMSLALPDDVFPFNVA